MVYKSDSELVQDLNNRCNLILARDYNVHPATDFGDCGVSVYEYDDGTFAVRFELISCMERMFEVWCPPVNSTLDSEQEIERTCEEVCELLIDRLCGVIGYVIERRIKNRLRGKLKYTGLYLDVLTPRTPGIYVCNVQIEGLTPIDSQFANVPADIDADLEFAVNTQSVTRAINSLMRQLKGR